MALELEFFLSLENDYLGVLRFIKNHIKTVRFYQISCVLCRFVRVKSLNIFRFDTSFSYFKTTFIPFLYQFYTDFNISIVTAFVSNHTSLFFQNTETIYFKTPKIKVSKRRILLTSIKKYCIILNDRWYYG